MFPYQAKSSVPPDKLVHQLLIQAFQAFYIQDYETGIHFLQQIKSSLPRYMYQLNPAYRSICKDVVKILQDGSLVPDRSDSNVAEAAEKTHPGLSGISSEEQQKEEGIVEEPSHEQAKKEPKQAQVQPAKNQPEASTTAPTSEASASPEFQENVEAARNAVSTDFISELSSAVASVKDKKKKKPKEDLTGSMDELEDFDF